MTLPCISNYVQDAGDSLPFTLVLCSHPHPCASSSSEEMSTSGRPVDDVYMKVRVMAGGLRGQGENVCSGLSSDTE